MDRGDAPDWRKKQLEYEERKARAKALKLRLTCTICGARPKTLLNCPCGTTQYCSTACQRIDWRDRGHRTACKKIRNERAAEAARAEAPTPPPPPPREVVYGPAPRSHADEVRARIAAEHEAARLRREANPEREPLSARFGSRCPICLEEWDVNVNPCYLTCCCRRICLSCAKKTILSCDSCSDETGGNLCPLCRTPRAKTDAEDLARIRRHVEDELPEAITSLAHAYRDSDYGLVKSAKKAAKLYKRAVQLGNVDAMNCLASFVERGEGVKLDQKKAMKLYRMASDRGNPRASCNLGIMLTENGATPPEAREAFVLFKRSADQGYTDSIYMVGRCYELGDGVEKDLDEAKRWFARAAAMGDNDAIGVLERLNAQGQT